MKQDKHLNFTHARTSEQQDLMQKIADDGVCPFCWEHFEHYHPKPIEEKTDSWIVTENMSPYEGTSLHLIFIYAIHTTSITDITPEGWTDLHDCIERSLKRHNKEYGALFIRFGDMSATGSSVAHLHAHLLCGARFEESSGEKIKVKFGYAVKA